MINQFLLFILFMTLESCSFLSTKVESLVISKNDSNQILNKEAAANQLSKKKNFCLVENNKTHLLLEDDLTMKYYAPLMPEIFDSKSFSFIQKAAMLSLIEMSRRPDKASPSARLQYYLKINKKNYYYDFRPTDLNDDSKMPYLKGIEFLIKNFDSSKKLPKIAETLDKILPQNINVGPELESFLQTNRNDLFKNKYLADFFFKGDEVLTKHESFKRVGIKQLISHYYSDNLSNDNFYESVSELFSPHSSQADPELKCNVDIEKDLNVKENFSFSEQKKSHSFAISEGDNFFIAVSSAITQKPFGNHYSTYLLKSRPTPHPLPICVFKNKHQEIILFSTVGRNPEQHLKHLAAYDILEVDSYQALAKLLNFSRHLFLSDPDRILYESKRGRKSQLDFFLTMNFPIYHVDSLGEIIGFAALKKGELEEKSLLIDDRSKSKLWCGEENLK